MALRKVRKLCNAGADVVVIAPSVLPELKLEPVTIILKKYSPEMIKGATLVFSATSDVALNKQICQEAKALDIWANSVNGVEDGSFIIPATCQKNILNVGITTEGKAPALSKALRKYFQNKIEWIPESLIEEIVALRAQKVSAKSESEKMVLENTIERKVEMIIKQMEQIK